MVFGALRRMAGRGKAEPPIIPVLEPPSSQPFPQQNFNIPAADDISGVPPQLPEPPRFQALPEPRQPEDLSPLPPATEDRRRQRLENFRRVRSDQAPIQPESPWPSPPPETFRANIPQSQSDWEVPRQWSPAPRQSLLEPERAPRKMSAEGIGAILDHLDRIEQRIMDVDRRLAMLESAIRAR